METIFLQARQAGKALNLANNQHINGVSSFIADRITEKAEEILSANRKDPSRIIPESEEAHEA